MRDVTERPTAYAPALGAEICALHGAGLSLAKICAREGMPSRATLYRWMAETPAFADLVARARHEQAAALTEEIVGIADAAADKDDVAVAKLRIDARRWLVETLLHAAPAKRGEGAGVPAPIAVSINLGDEP